MRDPRSRAGAIGGYFGGRLADAEADVTFLVRPNRRQQLERDGLRIEVRSATCSVRSRQWFAADLEPLYDVILFTCKAYDLDSAIDAIAPAVRGGCAIVPMLNGLSHVDRLDERFGSAHVMGGTCHINVMLGKDGVIRHGDPLQRLIFGERDGTATPRARALADALATTRFDWTLWADIEAGHVGKDRLPLGACRDDLSFSRPSGKLCGAGGREAMERALAANVEIATREGHPPRPGLIASARARLVDPAGAWSASMLRDLEGGGAIEGDHVVGWMLDKARTHGVDDIIRSLAYTHLKTYEARRDAKRLPNPHSPILRGG